MKILITAWLLLCSMQLTAQFQKKDFLELTILEGQWKMETKTGVIIEQWKVINDTTMFGKSFRIVAQDTLPLETVILKFVNGTISYNPTVPGQNEGKEVSFILNEIKGGQYIFQNPEHDFPKKIQYEPGNEFLKVTISGNQKEIHFHFKKLNERE